MFLFIQFQVFLKLIFFLLFSIYLAKSQKHVQLKGEICSGDSDNIYPLAILMSPGFIAGALPYVQNNECSEAGECPNFQKYCKDSSCCIGNNASTVAAFPALQTPSQCGCWDSKRKTCKPIDNFRLDWNICSEPSHFKVSRRFEFTRISKNVAKPCLGNSATVNFDVDKDMGYLNINIATKYCVSSQNARKGRQGNVTGDVINDLDNTIGNIYDDAFGSGNLKASPDKILLTLKQKSSLRPFLLSSKQQSFPGSNIRDFANSTYESEKHDFICNQNNGQSSASMTSGFLLGAAHDSLISGHCGNQGNCKVFTPACNKNRCCLLSNNENSTGVCDCLQVNVTGCLSDHKTFRIENTFCTENDEIIERQVSVKIPSSFSTNCKDGSASSWQMTSWDMIINSKDNVEILLKSKRCIESNGLVGGYFFEVEADVKVEMQLDKFQKTIEKLDKMKRDYDQNKLLAKE